MRIYFDNSATTPVDPEAQAAVVDAMQKFYGNPSSIHAEGRASRTAIEDARKTIAKYLNAGIGEIFFTSGGTESNNMVLKNCLRDLGVQRIISSPLEHHAIVHTLERIARENTEIEIVYLENDKKGNLNLQQLQGLLAQEDKKTLVSLMHANNEIGTLLNLQKVADLCQQYKAFFHTDTVQTMGYYPFDLNKTKIHFLTGSAHKFYGPKGVGFVYISNDAPLKPFIDGGSQERNMRGGTENIPGIVGMAKALDLAYTQLESRQKHVTELRNYLKINLLENFSDLEFVGEDAERGHYKILNVSFPPTPKSELLLFSLDISGVSASGGSACSSGVEGGSHVLTSLGIDEARKCIRFSFSHNNTFAEIDFLIEKLKTLTPLRTALEKNQALT
jgi:cysteine desulfurase